jgi:hypothetical protein
MKGVIKGLLGDLDHDGPGLFKRQELAVPRPRDGTRC